MRITDIVQKKGDVDEDTISKWRIGQSDFPIYFRQVLRVISSGRGNVSG
jgi:hypothetical protein